MYISTLVAICELLRLLRKAKNLKSIELVEMGCNLSVGQIQRLEGNLRAIRRRRRYHEYDASQWEFRTQSEDNIRTYMMFLLKEDLPDKESFWIEDLLEVCKKWGVPTKHVLEEVGLADKE